MLADRRTTPTLDRPGETAFLASYVEHWGRTTPSDSAITYVDYATDRHGVEHAIDFGTLERWSRALATRITEVTARGERIALLAPQGLEYGVGFTAALRTHAIVVPLFAPDLIGQGGKLHAVVGDCAPKAVLATREKYDLIRDFCGEHGIPDEQIIVIDDYREGHDDLAERYTFPSRLDLDDIAYLQYTSGSTRSPVGVCLTHRNLVENVLQLRDAYDISFNDGSTVSWLPLFHDMGLLLGVAAPVIGGLHSVLLDPVAFVLKPVRWLQAISGRQHVMTAAPNFAFDFAAKRVKAEDREELDLSGVIAWINGAEPVLPATLERFSQTFAPQGVVPGVVKPTYGLAEATVFVATTPPGESEFAVEVDSAQLQQGIATTDITSDLRPTTLISCGQPIGQHLAIVDAASRERLPDGHVGEIWISGANVGIGYWEQPSATEALFNSRIKNGGDLPLDGWLRTEDLGVYVNGRLHVTGRIKDLIILDGRNIYPHDVEFTVEEAHAAIAQRRLAAFSVPSEFGEQLVIVAERYRHSEAGLDLEAIAAAARQAVSQEHAVALHDFVLVEPDSIPRTSSGKIARRATHQAYDDGTLQRSPGA